jgi:protein-tyrosine phosphatase
MKSKNTSVLFVCLGNICRSPTAHAVFRQKLKQTKLNVILDSAGTAGYHIGATPDKRSIKHGKNRNYDFSNLFARAVIDDDFEFYNHILVMDKCNYQDLMDKCPDIYQHKINLFLDYATNYPDYDEVPDPYYGGEQGFETVLDLIEDASDGLINTLSK